MEFRSFGRRRGRKLRPLQHRLFTELLPRIAVDLPDDENVKLSLNGLFLDGARPLNLEIGFGGGEYLLWRALQFPMENFIGAEPFENGVAKCLSSMADAWGIDDVPKGNIRLFPDDVRDLLQCLPTDCVDRVDIMFPDPWPKLRHSRRRLINADLLQHLMRIIKSGGKLCIATDHEDYLHSILCTMRNFPQFDWQARSADDWQQPFFGFATRYAEKAKEAGRCGHYFQYLYDERFCLPR